MFRKMLMPSHRLLVAAACQFCFAEMPLALECVSATTSVWSAMFTYSTPFIEEMVRMSRSLICLMLRSTSDQSAGYGGAVSVYFGLSAELQLLHVSSFDLVLENNAVTNCGAFVYTKAGNAYGGGISVYMGGYSSVLSLSGNAMAAVGATDVRNVSVVMHKARFTSCRATRTNAGNLYGANTYGGSFSFYIGAYAWSQSWSALGISQSKCGPTTASELSVQVGDARCSRCIANVSTGGGSNGTMSVGGSLNAMYVGAYAWSNSQFSTSRSECAATTASRLRVQVSDAGCTNCNASVTSTDGLYSSASYGGFISAIYVGAHAVSFGFGDSYTTPTTSTSICQSTDVSSLSVSVRNVSCRDCSAFSAQLTSSASHLTGANVYGGFLSAMYIGAFSWSTCRSSNSSSTCAATVATNLSVQVSNAPCYNCRAFTLSESLGVHVGVNIFGGSLNALSIGARTYSIVLFGANIRSNFVFFPKSICESTIASNVAVVVSNAPCFSCSVSATAGGFFRGSANVFGGSMNVMFVGSFAWSYNVAQLSRTIVSSCGATTANNIAVGVSNASCHETCEAFVLSRNGNPFGVYAYGGSISALHVGSRAWSFDLSAFNLRDGRTTCEPTSARNLSVAVSDTRCRNCRCAVVLVGETYVANTIGGSISALYVGALAWSYSALSVIKSECQGIDAKDLNVHVSNMSCVNCSAYTYSGFSSFDSNAVGGALSAIYVADSAWGRGGNSNSGSSSITGPSYVQNSHIAVISSRFDSCNAGSYTFGTGSRISPLAWGGAIAMYIAAEKAGNTDSSNLTVVIMHSNFSQCKVVAFSTQAPKAQVSLNGGGAVFAIIPSLSKITVKNSTFKSSESQVLVGNSDSYPAKLNILLNILDAKGEPIDIAETVDTGATFSAGGALAIAALALFDSSLVEIESCTFINCTAQGANAGNLAVRGGAVAVDGVSAVTVKKSIFINCQILDASRNSTIGAIVSGGAGMSVGFVRDINIQHCTFNATNGRDSSGSSTGLLVLAPLSTRLHIKDCQFVSNETVFRFACVDGDGIRSFRCDLLDPSFVSVTDSNVRQTRSKDQQQLISFGKGVQASFTNFSMACLPNFTVFKDLSENEANIEYSCGTCPLFNISLTGSKVFLENLSSSDQMKCNSASKEVKLKCPLGISDCTTFVSVTSGFWTTFANFSNASSLETDRCPAGYCGCQSSPSCPLDPPLTADARQDQLCSGNRTGRLCGGCRPGFTHSGDDKTCIPNEECMKNLWWVWTLSILGYACFGLYIAVSCGEFGENSISCVLFYLQVSSFAANLDESNGSNAILEFALVRSLVTFSSACYAPSLGAYSATAAKLIGPLFVLFFSMAWTWFLQAFQSRLQQRDIRLHVTYSGTLTASVLFCFSSVAKVVFTLVECTSYNNNGVVFIDGTVSCYDANWKALMFIVVLLCLFPVVFAAALWLNKLPEDARAVICRNFTEPVFYWGAVTLSFRLMISLLQFLQVVLPNLLALIRMILSTAMLIMLVHLRPHVLVQTFWVDVVCYVCLIAQFGVQTMFADREYLAVAELEEQKTFFRAMSKLSSAFRSTASSFSCFATQC